LDILSYKRRALGYFPLDNWGGSSSNDGGSSTSDSGSGEGSTGGGGYSLGGISPSSSQAGGGGYQEEYQPPDDPVPAPAPPPPPAAPVPSVAEQYAAYGVGKQAADQLTGTGTAASVTSGQGGQIVTNNPASFASQLGIGLRTLLNVASGLPGLLGIGTMYARGEFDKLEKPSWAHQMDGASGAYWDNNTPQEARTWGGNGAPVTAYIPGSSVAARPAERAGNHLYSTSRPIASDPYSTAQPGFSLFPGTRPSTLTQSDPYYTQSQPANQNDGLVLAVLAGLAVIAFS
jgi:hypothetical protein